MVGLVAYDQRNRRFRVASHDKVELRMPTVNVEQTLTQLADVIEGRKLADPSESYVAKLFSKGPDAFLKKIGEEATEVVIAAKDANHKDIIYETADLWFHTLVMLAHYDLRPEQVLAELQRREGLSGLQEKAQRIE